jgi:hypothetical protein
LRAVGHRVYTLTAHVQNQSKCILWCLYVDTYFVDIIRYTYTCSCITYTRLYIHMHIYIFIFASYVYRHAVYVIIYIYMIHALFWSIALCPCILYVPCKSQVLTRSCELNGTSVPYISLATAFFGPCKYPRMVQKIHNRTFGIWYS